MHWHRNLVRQTVRRSQCSCGKLCLLQHCTIIVDLEDRSNFTDRWTARGSTSGSWPFVRNSNNLQAASTGLIYHVGLLVHVNFINMHQGLRSLWRFLWSISCRLNIGNPSRVVGLFCHSRDYFRNRIELLCDPKSVSILQAQSDASLILTPHHEAVS